MNYVSVEGLSKSFGDNWLFKNLSFGVAQGERVGLIGINGSGKSTLLKVLAGQEAPDAGSVSLRGGMSIGFLGQNPVFDEEATVFANVYAADNATVQLIGRYEEALLHNDHDALPDLTEQMTLADAWSYEQQIKEIVSRLELQPFIEKEVRYLSGGQRKRVAMARVLIEAPDLLILDEPTNHLDIETIEWLENLIFDKFKTIILVTHDRYFLDRVCTRIVELDRSNLFTYKGNYSYFLEKKAEREISQGTETERARSLMKRELEWIRRQPKARGTKAKYRVDAFEDLQEKAALRRPDARLELQVKTTRQGGKVLDAKRIRRAFGEQLIVSDFSYSFKRGEKIGIIGKNGTGKSTLLNMLTGREGIDRGALEMGETTVVGYYTQEDIPVRDNQRLIEAVTEIAESIELADGSKISASQFLQMFMFPPSRNYALVENLSGGERRRLQLLKILIKNPNFLVLDEPTNDLDIGTLNVLENFLVHFKGTLILVSHDRYFMDRLVDHLFVFEGEGEIRDFPGNYTDWREQRDAETAAKQNAPKIAAAPAAIAETKPTPTDAPRETAFKRNRTYKEQREYDTLSAEIAALEAEKATLEASIANPVSHNDIAPAAARLSAIAVQLDEIELRWLELDEWGAYGS